MIIIRIIYRLFWAVKYRFMILISNNWNRLKFKIFKIDFGNNLKINGMIHLNIEKSATCKVGKNLTINSGEYFNQIGRQQKAIIYVGRNALLKIGDNVGMSSVAIICLKEVIIEDNVKIGGNVVIYDSDFHSLDPVDRLNFVNDKNGSISRTTYISKNVFIGAHCTIMKGVSIGVNSIVGACSVVTCNIPSNQIWAGNPAKFIREL